MRVPKVTTTRITALWGGMRIALGVGALLAPRAGLAVWVDGLDPARGAVLGRALAGRDLAIGAGTVVAALSRQPVRIWVVAGGAADAVDAAATTAARAELSRWRRAVVLTASAGSAATAAVLAVRADR